MHAVCIDGGKFRFALDSLEDGSSLAELGLFVFLKLPVFNMFNYTEYMQDIPARPNLFLRGLKCISGNIKMADVTTDHDQLPTLVFAILHV